MVDVGASPVGPDVELLVVGGAQRRRFVTRQSRGCERGIVLRVNPSRSTGEIVFEHVTPAEFRAETKYPNISFRSAHFDNEQLYLCTQTEVLVVDYPTFSVRRRITHPWMNDLHHVCPGPDGSLLVTSTGLNSVLKVDENDEVTDVYNALQIDPWSQFDPSTDYRKVLSTRPYASWVSCSFLMDEKIWMTRSRQRDVVTHDGSDRLVPKVPDLLYDGVPLGRNVYFTTEKSIVVYDTVAEQTGLYDLSEMGGTVAQKLGRCRGILPAEDQQCIVGVSRNRPARLFEGLAWLKAKLRSVQGASACPTSIVSYDLEKRTRLWEMNLEAYGLGEIYSVHPVS